MQICEEKTLFPHPVLQEILAQAGAHLRGAAGAMPRASPSTKPLPAVPGGAGAAPGSLLRAAVPEQAAPAAPASFGLGVPASNQSSFTLFLQTRAQTFNHSS